MDNETWNKMTEHEQDMYLKATGRTYKQRLCGSCEIDTKFIGEDFMLNERLWKECMRAFEFDIPYLCITCVERLTKRLDPRDFIFCPLNYSLEYYRSKKLVNRLTTFEKNK